MKSACIGSRDGSAGARHAGIDDGAVLADGLGTKTAGVLDRRMSEPDGRAHGCSSTIMIRIARAPHMGSDSLFCDHGHMKSEASVRPPSDRRLYKITPFQ